MIIICIAIKQEAGNENEQTQTDALGTGSVGKLMFRLALPSITAQIINLLYNLVDRMYIGHMDRAISMYALTGVGVCLPLIMIISAFAALAGMAAPLVHLFILEKTIKKPQKISLAIPLLFCSLLQLY